MATPDTGRRAKVTHETVAALAGELVGIRVTAKDRDAVADLLNGLAADMAAFRKVNVGELEPAFRYDPGETES